MCETQRRALEAVGRAIAKDGLSVNAALSALEAGHLEDAPRAAVTDTDALRAAWLEREQELLARGREHLGYLTRVEALVRADLDGLEERVARRTLNRGELDQLGRLLVLLERAGKALKAMPGRGHQRTARITDSSSAQRVETRHSEQSVSDLAQRLAQRTESPEPVGNGAQGR